MTAKNSSPARTPRTDARTNIVLDTDLVGRVRRMSHAKTTREAVHLALEHYVRSHDHARILALHGTGGVTEDYDPKASAPARV